MKTTSKLRQLMASDQMIVAPFVINALHAKIAESVGFDAVYMTGAGTAAEKGFPDVGLLTMSVKKLDLAVSGTRPIGIHAPTLAFGDPAELLQDLLAVGYSSRNPVQWLGGQ